MAERVLVAAATAMLVTAGGKPSDEATGEAPGSSEPESDVRMPSPATPPKAQRAARDAMRRQDLAFQAAITRAVAAGAEMPPKVGVHKDLRPLARRHQFAPVPHVSGCTSPASMCADAAGLVERRPPAEEQRTLPAAAGRFGKPVADPYADAFPITRVLSRDSEGAARAEALKRR